MSLNEFLEQERRLLAMVGSLRSESLQDAALKLLCAKALAKRFKPGDEITYEEVDILAEDLHIPYTRDRLTRLLLGIGIVEQVAVDTFLVREGLSLRAFFADSASDNGNRSEVSFQEWLELIEHGGDSRGSSLSPILSVDSCLDVLERSHNWAQEIVRYCLRHQLGGVPVFWPCEEGGHRPLASDPGTLTTMDTLLLLVEPARLGVMSGVQQGWKTRETLDFLELVLGLQHKEEGWNCGAFSVKGPDDDFVGSFLPETGARGPCPNVEATGDALLALSVCYPLAKDIARSEDYAKVLAVRVQRAIDSGVRFLLRQQLEAGAWPSYRYEGDIYSVRPRDPSSMYAVDGIMAAVGSETLGNELCLTISAGIDRYLNWIRSTASEENGTVFWVPDFLSRDGSETTDRIRATTLVLHSLLSVISACPQRQGNLAEIIQEGIAFLRRHWEPNVEQYTTIQFQVPTWAGPADIKFQWEWPLDPLVVETLLLFYQRFSMSPDLKLRGRLQRAVADMISAEEHGHWVDFLMKQGGQKRGMPGNTLFYFRALLSYLAYCRGRLSVSPLGTS